MQLREQEEGTGEIKRRSRLGMTISGLKDFLLYLPVSGKSLKGFGERVEGERPESQQSSRVDARNW